MRKGLKRVLVVALAAIMVLTVAVPAFATFNCFDKKVKVKASVTVSFAGDEEDSSAREECLNSMKPYIEVGAKKYYGTRFGWSYTYCFEIPEILESQVDDLVVRVEGVTDKYSPQDLEIELSDCCSSAEEFFGDEAEEEILAEVATEEVAAEAVATENSEEELEGHYPIPCPTPYPYPCIETVYLCGAGELTYVPPVPPTPVVDKLIKVTNRVEGNRSSQADVFEFTIYFYDQDKKPLENTEIELSMAGTNESDELQVPNKAVSYLVQEKQPEKPYSYTATKEGIFTEGLVTVDFVNTYSSGSGGGGGTGGTGVGGPAADPEPAVAPEPALDAVPKTGMPMEYSVWMIIMIISALALVSLVVIKKKEN